MEHKEILCLAALPLFLLSCSEWLEPESINGTDYNGTTRTEEYYASLREWKQTPGLPQVFVWFDNWTGTSPTGASSLRGLPDSVTIASNWGSSGADTTKFDLSEAKKADMAYVQNIRGTKVVFTMFSRYVGEGLPYSKYPHWYNENKEYDHKNLINYYDYDKEEARKLIRRYAEDLYHACIGSGYDGYDWDYEPGFGMGSGADAPFWSKEELSCMFVEEMSYWFGRLAMDPSRDRGDRPMPERRLLFLIDGSIGTGGKMFDSWPAECFDYYVLQAYNTTSEQGLSNRVYNALEDLRPTIEKGTMTPSEAVGRIIATENFESYATSGGGFLLMSRFVYNGMFDGETVNRQIGGCGMYRVGFDYDHGNSEYNGYPEYYFLRQGITNLYRIYRERLAMDDGDNANEMENE